MHSKDIVIEDYVQNGNYSFQYCRDVEIHHAVINSKDAFWNTENVTVYDSEINGEYLGWHSKNLRLVNCKISGTQPLCYAHELVMEIVRWQTTVIWPLNILRYKLPLTDRYTA